MTEKTGKQHRQDKQDRESKEHKVYFHFAIENTLHMSMVRDHQEYPTQTHEVVGEPALFVVALRRSGCIANIVAPGIPGSIYPRSTATADKLRIFWL